MIELETTTAGVILPVKAHPGARCDGLQGWQQGALRVNVSQIAEKGRANKAIRDTIAKSLALRKSQVDLVAGATSQYKRFLITGIETSEIILRIRQAIRD